MNSIIPTNTPAPSPTMNFIMNGISCSITSVSAIALMFCIRSSTRNGRMTVSGVLNMLSNFSIVSVLDFPPSPSTTSGDVPVITAANSRLLQNGICSM